MAFAVIASSAFAEDSKEQPQLPYYDWGACPFECCTYREWKAPDRVKAYADYRDEAAVIFEIDKGEWFTALTGVVITYKVGITKVLKPVEMGYANGVKYPAIKAVPGDTLYKLHYLGEGFVLFWYKGKIYSDQFPPETSPNPPSAENKIQTITRPEVGWWVKIKNKKGQIGWINVLVYFENSDSCS